MATFTSRVRQHCAGLSHAVARHSRGTRFDVTFSDTLVPLAPGEDSAPPAPPQSPTIAPIEPTAPDDAGL